MTCYVDVDNGEDPYESCALNEDPDDCEIALELLAKGKASPKDCKHWKGDEPDCFKSINVSKLYEEIRMYKIASEQVGQSHDLLIDNDTKLEALLHQGEVYDRILKLLIA